MIKSTTSYKNKKYKEYPANRICVIDFYPLIIESIDESFRTCQQLGITGSQWSKHTKDISRLFLHHTLDKLCTYYNECPSKYRKVYVIYPIRDNTGVTTFINNNLQKILKVCPLPWCNTKSFESTDTELAAVKAFETKKCDYSRLLNFTKNNSLHAFTNKIQKKRFFSNSIVDFSRSQE